MPSIVWSGFGVASLLLVFGMIVAGFSTLSHTSDPGWRDHTPLLAGLVSLLLLPLESTNIIWVGVAGYALGHVLLGTAAVVAAVFVQVYLIGAYLFGAGEGALSAHKAVGYAANELEGVVLIAALVARLPRRDVLLSLALAVIGTVQIGFAQGHRWVGGLHPLLALVVFHHGGAAAPAASGRLRIVNARR